MKGAGWKLSDMIWLPGAVMLWKISTATTKIAFSIGGVDAYKAARPIHPLNVAVAAGINGNG
jgi:hypothetical protein